MEEPITGAEAAVALQNALDLSADELEMTFAQEAPQWAATSLAVMAANGVELDSECPLTRGQAAQALYRASRMAVTAPGAMVFKMQE